MRLIKQNVRGKSKVTETEPDKEKIGIVIPNPIKLVSYKVIKREERKLLKLFSIEFVIFRIIRVRLLYEYTS